MANNLTPVTTKPTLEWYEEQIPLRGCSYSLDDIRLAYRELAKLNQAFGQKVVDSLPPEEGLSPDEWEAKKVKLLDEAFRLTVTIHGERDQRIYFEDESGFQGDNLPSTITRVYFTNVTAFRRNAGNTDPINQLEVILDFSKPPLFDSETVVSSPTPNLSSVNVYAREQWFCCRFPLRFDPGFSSRSDPGCW